MCALGHPLKSRLLLSTQPVEPGCLVLLILQQLNLSTYKYQQIQLAIEVLNLLRSRTGQGTFESRHDGLHSQLLWARRMSSSPSSYTPSPAPGFLNPLLPGHCEFRHDQTFWRLRNEDRVWLKRCCCGEPQLFSQVNVQELIWSFVEEACCCLWTCLRFFSSLDEEVFLLWSAMVFDGADFWSYTLCNRGRGGESWVMLAGRCNATDVRIQQVHTKDDWMLLAKTWSNKWPFCRPRAHV